MKKNINILLTSTPDEFLKYVCVAIESIFCNKNILYNYNIYVFVLGSISINHQQKFDKYNCDNFSVKFINVDTNHFNKYKNIKTKKWHGYCARLLVDKYLTSIDKILYIDSDIVLNGDISELFNIDLGKNIIGVCKDCVNRSLSQDIHLSQYFNSGVLLINLRSRHIENIGEKSLKLLDKEYKKFLFPDQDALNYVLDGKWKNISPEWNGIETGTFTSKGTQYSDDEFKKLRTYKLCHFAGPLNRPQNYICVHPKRYLYYKYLFKTKYWSSRDIFCFISHIITSNCFMRFVYKIVRFLYLNVLKSKKTEQLS